MLNLLGIGSDEQLAYEALIDCGAAVDNRELRSLLAWDAPRAAAALAALEAKGLIGRPDPASDRVQAIDPELALDVLFLAHEERFKRARLMSERLADRFREAARQRQPGEVVETVTGFASLHRRLEHVFGSPRRVMRSLDRPPYFNAPLGECEGQWPVLKRGVRWMGIYDRRSVAIPGLLSGISASVAGGEEARVLGDLPMKMHIADDRVAFVHRARDSETDLESAFIIRSSSLLDGLITLFDALWEQAIPFRPAAGGTVAEAAGGGPAELSAGDRQILAMLAAGATDRAIAKELDVSYRTAQRRIHDLLESLHATTRFQAGLQAARRNLL